MTVVKAMTLLFVLGSLLGCASQVQRSNPSANIAEKQGDEQPQKSALPIFTYRPGG